MAVVFDVALMDAYEVDDDGGASPSTARRAR